MDRNCQCLGSLSSHGLPSLPDNWELQEITASIKKPQADGKNVFLPFPEIGRMAELTDLSIWRSLSPKASPESNGTIWEWKPESSCSILCSESLQSSLLPAPATFCRFLLQLILTEPCHSTWSSNCFSLSCQLVLISGGLGKRIKPSVCEKWHCCSFPW